MRTDPAERTATALRALAGAIRETIDDLERLSHRAEALENEVAAGAIR